MNKSTPINQLPIQNTVHKMGQPPMQAPPPLQSKSDGNMQLDDDATIQDVLNKLNSETTQQQQTETFVDQDYNSLMMEATQPVAMQMPMQAYNHHMDSPYGHDEYGVQTNIKNKLMSEIMTFNDSVKISLIAGLLFVAVYFLPIERLVFKYMTSVEHIPNAHVLIKSMCFVVLMFLAQKLL